MPNNKKELMQYRLDMAKERLDSAMVLLKNGSYKDSIGRSYYSMFTAVRALLAMEGVDFSKHSAVIAHFQKEYIKTGKVDKKFSKYSTNADSSYLQVSGMFVKYNRNLKEGKRVQSVTIKDNRNCREEIGLSNCETCAHYEYDEDYECYTCQMNLDEDELYRFVTNAFRDCPYYNSDDEYTVVRHQM